MNLRVSLLVVLTVACCARWTIAQQGAPAPGFSFKADRIERLAEHTLKATGNVEADGRGFHLRADSLEVSADETGVSGGLPVEIIAEGNVILTRGQERLTLQRLQFSPRTGSGTFLLR